MKDAFRKQKLEPGQWLETVFLGGDNRRRATFTALKQHGKILVGYYRRRSNQITDIRSCLIADPKLLELRSKCKSFLKEILRERVRTDIFVQLVDKAVDMVITGPVGRKGEPDRALRELVAQWMEAAHVTRISWRASERDSIRVLAAKDQVVARFGPLKINLPPAAFLQPTVEGEQALVSAVLAVLPPSGKFADLFSGCGTFSGPMVARGSVDAYESATNAVNALSKAQLSGFRVFRRDLFRNPLRRDEINRYDVVCFDPPRAGCREQVAEMACSKAPILVGVSCNPATFARDTRILCDGGYRLQSLQIVDQFLWSHSVELVGVLSKGTRGKF
ncbi:MAG: class I SAM-dependent RNA methyltransferase [Deltaproteobacteria bacterium]|nr:class I SAM-dependent RNA methyltransferase [Deltaproteobacteria bacterium]